MKKIRNIVSVLTVAGVVTLSSVMALAASWAGSYEGHEYVKSLSSTRISSDTPTYQGEAQTRWGGGGKVYAYVEGVNSTGGRISGSNIEAYGSDGFASVKSNYITLSSLAYWNSSHKILDSNNKVKSGSELWYQIKK